MDRQIVYPGAIPLETDLLNTNKYAMMGLAKLSAAMMGSNTYLHGLACTPSSPASMVVNVAKGQIYSLQNVDGTAYSSLAADTTNTILKQGIILGSTLFTLTAPTTAGQSINYLIQVAYSDMDSGATVLPYYNASNPSVAYSGPNNSGTAQNTVRSGVCVVALKAGVAATTGTQTTPAPDTGYTAVWVVTVAQGASTVTASNITVAPNAPFLPAGGVFSAVQQGTLTFAADSGAANAYAASYLPVLPTITDGMRLTFKAKTANTGSCTFSVNGGSAFPLYSHAHQALQGGEIIANGLVEVEWNSSLTAWVMCGNSGGSLPVAMATKPNQAPQLSQVLQSSNNLSEISSAGANSIFQALSNLGLINQVADNMIINGSFIINQRGYSSGNALTAGSYAHDRWKAGSGGAAYSFGTTAETITITSGTLIQVIEGLNNYGDPITLVWDGTAQCRVNGGAYSASPLTVNNLAAGSNITIEFGTGSVARVQCSPGVVPFRYRRRQYGDELRLCQRYYQMSTSGTTGTFAPNGSDSHVPWFMKVTMRAAPTVLLSGGNGTVYQSSPDYVDVKLTAGSQSYAVIVNISCAAEL